MGVEKTNTPEYRIISSLVHSQASLHSAFGGVYPALAKREHGKNLVPLLIKLLDESGLVTKTELSDKQFREILGFKETTGSFVQDLSIQNPDLIESVLANENFLRKICHIDQIAVTEGPGLEPALWVGINFARILGALWKIPITPINHMEGHIVGSLIPTDKPYGTWFTIYELPLPSVALLISGGHTELVCIKKQTTNTSSTNTVATILEKEVKEKNTDIFSYKIIGETRDDAVGEAFDKVARLLDLPYPGGPHISKLATEARERNIPAPLKLPRPMIGTDDCAFSFSGLKTAVLYAVREERAKSATKISTTNNSTELSYDFRAGLAREFEDAITEVIEVKLKKALEIVQLDQSGQPDQTAQSIIVGGGVSANHTLRVMLEKVSKEYDIPLFMPSQHISGDNALMIALAATINYKPYSDSQTQKPIKAHGTKRL